MLSPDSDRENLDGGSLDKFVLSELSNFGLPINKKSDLVTRPSHMSAKF